MGPSESYSGLNGLKSSLNKATVEFINLGLSLTVYCVHLNLMIDYKTKIVLINSKSFSTLIIL